AYKKARRKFSMKTYILLAVWLILALVQWVVVCFVEDMQKIFKKYYYICIVTFVLAILLFALFLFFEKLRYSRIAAPILSLLIVELQIISLFALVAYTYCVEMLVYFVICVLLLAIFIIIGIFLPRKIDLTLDVAILFILSFIFLIVAMYFLVAQLVITSTSPFSYLTMEICITIIMLFFIMYHAQTINGSRFAEMRLNDWLLGSLILFHDFLIIYWLTFYWQHHYKPITPEEFYSTTDATTNDTNST
ncbi:hypothetical protein KR222_005084, partial [Zaprionus bogoriensis]